MLATFSFKRCRAVQARRVRGKSAVPVKRASDSDVAFSKFTLGVWPSVHVVSTFLGAFVSSGKISEARGFLSERLQEGQ